MNELFLRTPLLHELLIKNGARLREKREHRSAEEILRLWRQAVAGGNEELFRKRLTWDGLPHGQALLQQLAASLHGQTDDRPLTILQAAVDLKSDLSGAAAALGAWVARRASQGWPRGWHEFALPSLQTACTQQLGELLRLAAAGTSVPAWELFRQRPIVARWVEERAQEWASGAIRLAWRYHRDRDQLSRAFSWPYDKSLPIACRWGLADRHNGESVVALEFEQGPTLFYKPRSLQPEKVLHRWLEIFRLVGVPVAPLPPMLSRQGYGWVQGVPWARLESRQEVQAWFTSAGALLAVAWLLGMQDLHWENVVAGPEGPVVVDGEIWAQPVTSLGEGALTSVLTSGLLTMPVFRDGVVKEEGALFGGLHPEAKSLPLWRGKRANPFDFAQELLGGFEESLERIAKAVRREGFAAACWAAMEKLKVRWLARPSHAYAHFLSLILTNPKVRAGWQASLMTEALLRPLVVAFQTKPPFWKEVKEEQQALLRLSVPRLEISVGKKQGAILLSGKQCLQDRVARLTSQEIRRQVREVERILLFHPSRRNQDLFWRRAQETAAQLAAGNGEGQGIYLRSGLAGSALSWAAWARVSQDPKSFRRAQNLYEKLAARLVSGKDGDFLVGFCSGLGGVVFSLAAGAALLEEESYGALAAGLAKKACHLSKLSNLWDVEGGQAGFLLGTWSLLGRFPELREDLVALAYQLLGRLELGSAKSDPALRLPGFAHGVSGVAAAVSLVAKACDDTYLSDKAKEVLAAEEGAGRWLARGERYGSHVPVDLRGWCHGPPGAFLARALAIPSQGPELLQAQEREALALSLEASPLGEPSLCCGTIGRNEILLVGAQLRGKEALLQQAKQQAETLCRWPILVDRLPTSGGLFSGRAGWLFHLCRLLAPREVGSALFGEVLWSPRP